MNAIGPLPQTDPQALTGPEQSSVAQVDAMLLREQYMRLDRPLLVPLGLLVLVALAHSGAVAPLRLLLWVGLMFTLFYLRRRRARMALAAPLADTVREHRRLYRAECVGAAVMAAGFASCVWLLDDGRTDALFSLRLVFLCGAAAVTLGLLGLHPRIYGIFLTVMIAMLAAYLTLVAPEFFGGRLPSVAIIGLFAVLLHSRSRDEYRQAREGILARINKDLLVERLREALAEQQAVRANLEFKSSELEASNQKLSELAIHDALTGAYNRGHVQELLRQGVARFTRYRQPLCVLILDIDHFKMVNDRHGHATGDEVLRQMSGTALACLREGDLFGRWGGEEFIALLPNITLAGAADAAERLSAGIKALRVDSKAVDGAQVKVTVSIGVAEIQDGESAESLVARADAALYAAKDAGRDRVMLAGGMTPTLVSSSTALPPEGADPPWGGPAADLTPTLVPSGTALPTRDEDWPKKTGT
jgi:diguanylate cyclase (GGDEF)-like protein